MERLSLVRVASRTAAKYIGTLGDAAVTHISTDSRQIEKDCLFIALQGERFDGHRFVSQALRDGAAWAMVSEKGSYPEDRILLVKDTRTAFLETAGLYRSLLNVKVVGVTGSVGKTTTKEIIACVTSAAMPTLKTEANLNNDIGLPQMILRLDGSHRAAVLEMGMDAPGQIAPLSRCAQPDIGVVTNIGVSHLEALGTRENILKEKLDITAGMREGAKLVLCGDDPLLRGVKNLRQEVLFYGIDDPQCGVRAANIKEFPSHTTFEIIWEGSRLDAQIPCLGRHNVYNALAAFSVGVLLEIEPRTAVAALKTYKPAGMRQNIVVHNSYTVVEDCYNASPDSMRAALATLGKLACEGRRIAVLSDMLELGSAAEESHREIGRLAAMGGVDLLLCTGALSALYAQEASRAGMEQVMHFETQEELFEALREILSPGDVAWFKASRGMRLEQVIERIYKEC